MVPLAIFHPHLEVQQSGVPAEAVGQRDVAAHDLREVCAVLHAESEVRVASEGPADGEQQILGYEFFDDLIGQWEIFVALVILEDDVDALAEQRKKACERPDRGKHHDVVHLPRERQKLHAEAFLLEQGPQQLHALGFSLLLPGQAVVVLRRAHFRLRFPLQVTEPDFVQLVGAQHLRKHDVLGKPHHTATRNSRQRRIFERIHFEHDPHVRRDCQALAVGKGQHLVVVQNRIQVFRPFWIHVAVEHNPLPPFLLPPGRDAPQDVSEHAVSPFQSGAVQLAIKLLFANCFWVHHETLTLDAVNLLHGVQQSAPHCRFARAHNSHQHHAVGNALYLVQLHALEHEILCAIEVAQLAQPPDLVLQDLVVDRRYVRVREHAADEARHQGLVLGHELRDQCVENRA
mmetsp:Transcript_98082/g.299848  ORF Transcript_98082/g.299848 Transcript_98082/m.299848 type:complete len:402 (+) Transcript_98082:6404-7609(+)